MTFANPSLKDQVEKWYVSTRQHAVLIASVFFLTLAASVIYVERMPNVYRAETRILVNPQRVSDKYVSSAVSTSATERLNTLSQQVLSSSRLETVFNDFNLFPDLRGKVGHQELIDKMRHNIGIELKQSADGPSSFTLSYQGESPQQVADVTNRLAESFIDWNLHDRAQEAQGTTEFLANELSSTKAQLDQLDEQLRVYKLQHLGQLPDQLQANMQALSRLQLQLQANLDAQNRLDHETLLAKDDQPDGQPAGVPYQTNRQRLQGEIATTNHELSDLKARYTAQFPDVLSKQEQLAKLESQLASTRDDDDQPAHLAPVSANHATTTRAQISTMDRNRLVKAQHEIEAQINSYQSRVDSEPIREQEISQLLRDYETARLHYASLLDKSYSAQMAAELEQKQQGGNFTLLDVARPPDTPIGPNRIGLLFAAFMVSFGVGAGAGVLREVFDSTIKTESELRQTLPGVNVLGLVPCVAKEHTFSISRPSTWRDQMNKATQTSEHPQFKDVPAALLTGAGNARLLTDGHSGAGGYPVAGPSNGRLNLDSVPTMVRAPRQPNNAPIFETAPLGLAAEQFRVMQKRLVNSAPQGGTALLTSPGAGDGKSLNAQNLAWALAEAGHSTLLLELDLRRPAQAKFLRPPPQKSMDAVLEGRSTPGSAVRRVSSVPLFYIGLTKPVNNPTELLRSAELRELFAWARLNFTWIIIDGPPVLAISDVEELLPNSDIVLMIARARTTPRVMLERAAERLGKKLNLLIFNDVPFSGSYGYSYGQN